MHRIPAFAALVCLALGAALAGCYGVRSSDGGGQTRWDGPRHADPADVAVPGGYRIEVVAQGLSFPTGVTFDAEGRPCVVEAGYCYGEVFGTPRLLRVQADGTLVELARGAREDGPWNGVAFDGRRFVVTAGGVLRGGGALLAIDGEGRSETLLDGLPGLGDHHVNGPVLAPDGALLVGIGTATNSGIVGEDNASFGWLHRYPAFHDIPGGRLVLRGVDVETDDPLTAAPDDRAVTGAFQPFGTPSSPGQIVEGRVPCTGAILRLPPGASRPELVAWGLRNPFGLAFAADGTLYVTENAYDDRGSRPVWGAGDVLWRIEPGLWYGWPDFAAGRPLTREEFQPPSGPPLEPLLAEHPNVPPTPVAELGVHASACGLDLARDERFGRPGDAYVALFGDMAPGVGKTLWPVGFSVVRVEPDTGVVHPFAANRGDHNGPASWLGTAGLERPVDVRFHPDGDSLYVVDFGVLQMEGDRAVPHGGTGVLWRIVREAPPVLAHAGAGASAAPGAEETP